MSSKALKVVPAERSPQRAKLAEIIERLAAGTATLTNVRQAVDAAFQQITAADEAVTSARLAIDTARAGETAYLVAKARGDAGAAPPSVREARAALSDAEERLELCREAKRSLEAEVAKAEGEVAFTRQRLDDALAAVAMESAEVEKYMVDFIALRAEIRSRRNVIRLLGHLRMVPKEFQNCDVESHAERIGDSSDPAVAAWKASIEAMKTDPDAPLPTAT